MILIRKQTYYLSALIFFLGVQLSSFAQCPTVFDFYGEESDAPYWYQCSGNDFNFNLQSPDNWGEYEIDWGDGSPVTTGTSWTSPAPITHFYPAAVDTFNVVITEVSSGCVINGVVVMEEATSASIQIPVGGLTQACAPQEMEFINSATNVSETTVFTWDFGDGSPIETYDYTNWNETITHTYEVGTVDCETEVSLTAQNYCNIIQGGFSEATFNPIRIWDVDDASIDASALTLCYPDTTVQLTNTTERNCLFQGNIEQRYEYWNFGDYWGQGTDSIIDWTPWPPTFPHTLHYPGLGTYNAMLIDSNFCGLDTAYITINIVEPPIADIALSADTSCVGEVSTFYQNSTGYIDNYSWNFGDGSGWINTGSSNISYAFNAPGTYDVCCAVGVEGSGACSDTTCVTVVIQEGPDATIIMDNFEDCNNLEVNYTENSTNAVEWEWTFDVAPFTHTGQLPPTIYYDQVGTYDVTLEVTSANGCTSEVSEQVFVYPSPDASFEAANVCENSLSEFIDTSVADPNDPILSWYWEFGDGETSSFQHPSHAYTGTGSFDVTLTVNTANCSSSITNTVNVDPSPIAEASVELISSCSPLEVSFENASVNASNYLWDFGDGNTTTNANPLHTFYHFGDNDTIFTVTLTAISDLGCSHVDSLEVPVSPGAVAGFVDNSIPPGCAPFDAEFVNTSQGASSYLWDFGDGETSTEENPEHTFFNETGYLQTFDISLIAYAPNGCNDTVYSQVTVYPTPNFDFTIWPDSGCSPLMVTMPFVQGVNEFTWDFGDGEFSEEATPTHVYTNDTTEPIIYDVTLFGISAFGCADTAYSSVIVNPQPIAQFAADALSGCSPLEVNLSNFSIQSDFYEWNYGDGNLSDESADNHLHTFVNISEEVVIYEVVLTAYSDDGCSDSFMVPIEVYPEAQASFATVPDACTPEEITFDNTSINGVDFQWDLGNGLLSADENPTSFYVNDTGSSLDFEACVVVTSDMGCVDSYCQTFTINPNPTASFALSTETGCNPAPVEITNTSQLADSYQWYYGDGLSSTIADEIHEHVFTGNSDEPIVNTIMLVAQTEFGCTDTTYQDFTLNPQVNAVFIGNTAGCSPLEVDFNNLSQGANDGYMWTFGDGDTSYVENPTHIFFNNTLDDIDFEVNLIATSVYGCSDTTSQDITVYHTPISDVEIDTTMGCYPLEVTFSNQSVGAIGYTWVYGTGQTGTTDDPLHSYVYYNNFSDSPVTYDVTLIAYSDQGCSSSDDLTVEVWPELEADFMADDEACSPFAVAFQNTSVGAINYNWTFGDGLTSAEENPEHVFYNSSVNDLVYDVQLIATSFYGCEDTIQYPVTVLATPIADFQATPELQMYPNATVELLNNSQAGDVSYTWNMDDGNDLTEENPEPYTYSTWGNYIIELILDNGSCADTAWQAVEILPPPPVASFEMDTLGCAPLTLLFHSTSTAAASYFWDFGDGGQAFVSDPVYTYYQPGTYNVTLTVTGYGEDQEDSFTVQSAVVVNASAIAAFTVTPTEVSVPDEPITCLNFSLNATSYEWNFGDGNYSNLENPVHYYEEEGIYDILLIANNDWGCPDTTIMPAAVNAEAAGEIAFPNAFTPDLNYSSGGIYDPESFNNNVFRPVYHGVSEYNLQIYNKWGELLFESEDVTIGWDGYYQGQVAKEDVYVWKAKVRFSDGTRLVEAGDVTLLIK